MCRGFESHPSSSFFFSEKKELFGLVASPFFLFIEKSFHVLSECSAYSSTRGSFMKKLQELLEDDYEEFESLENVEKSSYVLGSEL